LQSDGVLFSVNHESNAGLEVVLYCFVLAIAITGYRLTPSPLKDRNLGVFRPLRLLFTVWLSSLTVSYLGFFQLVKLVDIFSPIDFRLALEIELLAVVGVLIGFNLSQWSLAAVRPWKSGNEAQGPISMNLRMLEILSSLMVFACAAAVFLLFKRTGIVPMLAEGSRDELRFEMANAPGAGLFTRFIYLSPVVISMKLTCMVLSPKGGAALPRWLDFIGLCVLFSGLFFFGSKMLYVAPLILFAMNYNIFIRPFKLTLRWVAVGLVSIFLLTLITNLRGTQNAVIFGPISDVLVVFPEFREMAETVNIADRQHLYINSYWVLGAAALPREIYEMIGMEKPDSQIDKIAYFTKDLLGENFAGGSSRTGLFAEFFLNSRWMGVLIGSAILGSIFAVLEGVLAESRRCDFKAIIVNVLAFRLSWCVLADLSTNASVIYLDLYFLILVYFLVHRKYQTGKVAASTWAPVK
jgi:hypothetical protein